MRHLLALGAEFKGASKISIIKISDILMQSLKAIKSNEKSKMDKIAPKTLLIFPSASGSNMVPQGTVILSLKMFIFFIMNFLHGF